MKNIQLLNTCYKFFNRFITVNELIEQLTNFDKTNLTKKDLQETTNIIEEIKAISKNTPNKVDEYVIKRKENIKETYEKLEKLLPKEKNKEKLENPLEVLVNHVNKLKDNYNKEIDSYERWFKVTDYLNKNSYFNECFDSLSAYELLEFIAQYLQAPFPPQLSQDEFAKIVKAGIEKDEREWLWRLAFNYENHNFNFDSIVDYFIKVKDSYYLSELVSAVGDCLDLDRLVDQINDKKLIEELL